MKPYELIPMKPFGVMLQATTSAQHVSELPATWLRELAREHHIVALRGFETFESSEDFAQYTERFGEISIWPFGKVLELIEQKNPQDHIFDSNYVPMHWDGMYRPHVPEFQVFHCARAPGGDEGGRTTFSDTTLVLKNATPATRALWEKVTGVYHRKMEFYDSKTVAPIVTQHPVRGFPVIRYCEPPRAGDENFVNHPEITFEGLAPGELADFLGSLNEALYAPENLYSHAWQSGDIVITDNYTLLHGREAFTSGSPRYLRRVHILGEPALNNPHLISHV